MSLVNKYSASFTDWHIGELVYLNARGERILLLGSASAVEELLEKRSANTSDRSSTAVMPLIGNDTVMSLMPYGQRWRHHRRAFWQVFHPAAARQYRKTQQAFLHKFLKKLVASPLDLKQHIRYVFAATMVKVLYDIDTRDDADELIARMDEAAGCTSELASGTHPVDIFPFLQHVPSWVPGAGFQHAFAKCRAAVRYIKDEPFVRLKSALDRGQAGPCVMSTLMSRISSDASTEEIAYHEDVAKNVGLVAFEGGADTSYSTLQAIFLAVSQRPEVLRKAQAELHAVVGPNRLPDFEDRDKLVYVNAILKEAIRWHVVLPISLPHRTVEDDEYGGYFIPAGTSIIPNTWAILHDPEIYSNPDEFIPERFIKDGSLDPTVRDPGTLAFGYGRRVCPGKYFAEDSLYLTVASILHVFDIGPPIDEAGQPIMIEYRLKDGLLAQPADCRCTIKPRSPAALALINDARM
ncbi:cytochrome P450 [Lenzites betulinus]|nr:cytochrome P450 [Lenzites betulinus]